MFWGFAYHCKKIYIDLVCGCLKQWKCLETFQRSESESTRSKVGWLSKERLFMCSFYSYKRWYIIYVVLGCLEKQILITSYVCTTYSVLPHKTQSAANISHQNPFFSLLPLMRFYAKNCLKGQCEHRYITKLKQNISMQQTRCLFFFRICWDGTFMPLQMAFPKKVFQQDPVSTMHKTGWTNYSPFQV